MILAVRKHSPLSRNAQVFEPPAASNSALHVYQLPAVRPQPQQQTALASHLPQRMLMQQTTATSCNSVGGTGPQPQFPNAHAAAQSAGPPVPPVGGLGPGLGFAAVPQPNALLTNGGLAGNGAMFAPIPWNGLDYTSTLCASMLSYIDDLYK